MILIFASLSFIFPLFTVRISDDEDYRNYRPEEHKELKCRWFVTEKVVEEIDDHNRTYHYPYNSSNTGNGSYQMNDVGHHLSIYLNIIVLASGIQLFLIIAGPRAYSFMRLSAFVLPIIAFTSMFMMFVGLFLGIQNDPVTERFGVDSLVGTRTATGWDTDWNTYHGEADVVWYPGLAFLFQIMIVFTSIAVFKITISKKEQLIHKDSRLVIRHVVIAGTLLLAAGMILMSISSPVWTIEKETEKPFGGSVRSTEEEWSWNPDSAEFKTDDRFSIYPRDVLIEIDRDDVQLNKGGALEENYDHEKEVMFGAEILTYMSFILIVVTIVLFRISLTLPKHRHMMLILLVTTIFATTALPVFVMTQFPDAMEHDAQEEYAKLEVPLDPDNPDTAINGFSGSYEVGSLKKGGLARYEWGPSGAWYLWVASAALIWIVCLSQFGCKGIHKRWRKMFVILVFLLMFTGSVGGAIAERDEIGPFSRVGKGFPDLRYLGYAKNETIIGYESRMIGDDYQRTFYQYNITTDEKTMIFQRLNFSFRTSSYDDDRILFIDDHPSLIKEFNIEQGRMIDHTSSVEQGINHSGLNVSIGYERVVLQGDTAIVGTTIRWQTNSSRYGWTDAWYAYDLDDRTVTNLSHLFDFDLHYWYFHGRLPLDRGVGAWYFLDINTSDQLTYKVHSIDAKTWNDTILYNGTVNSTSRYGYDKNIFMLRYDNGGLVWSIPVLDRYSWFTVVHMDLSTGDVTHYDREFHDYFNFDDGRVLGLISKIGEMDARRTGLLMIDLRNGSFGELPSILTGPLYYNRESVSIAQVTGHRVMIARELNYHYGDRYFSSDIYQYEPGRDWEWDYTVWRLDLTADTDGDGTVDWQDDDIDGDGKKNDDDYYPYLKRSDPEIPDVDPPKVKEILLGIILMTCMVMATASFLFILKKWKQSTR